MGHQLIDTNVPLATVNAEGKFSLTCQQACLAFIKAFLAGKFGLVLDLQNEVLAEYRKNMYPDPRPSSGLAGQFLLYIINHQGYPDRVLRVDSPKDANGDYSADGGLGRL